MSKKKKTLIAVLAILGIAVVGLSAGVLAKYFTDLGTKSGSANIAKWTFRTNNESATIDCDLGTTYDPATLVAEKIAPGTSGTCDIELSNANGEVAVDYEITISSITGPSTLVFKNGSTTYSAGSKITGTIAPNGTEPISIDWEWPYEGGADTADTTAGEAAGTMGISFSITGTQVEPVEQ